MANAAGLVLGSWIVFWGAGGSEQAYRAHARDLDEVVVFAYRFGEDGRMIPSGPDVPKILERLRAERPPRQAVFVSVVNDTTRGSRRVLKDPDRVAEMLSAPDKTEAHLLELLALSEGLSGLELDYENLRGRDGPAYAAFVERLATRLRERGQRLHLVAQAKLDARPGDGARALDWARLGAAVDRLNIMAYNYRGEGSREPGPVCPLDWAERLVDFALTQVPARKLGLILALHGFAWTEGEKGRAIQFADALAEAAKTGAAVERDPASGARRFTVTSGGRRRTFWFEDAVSVAQKAALASERGLAAVYLWRLGTGDPAVWDALPQKRAANDRP